MPAISLVVCVHRQRDFLERLIRESAGCYDELVVLHDLPDTQNVRAVAESAGGRFFERPPAFLQEPHWPFAWGEAKHNWILRLDADEFPSEGLKNWLREFRHTSEAPAGLSGFTCIWPLWDGRRRCTSRWPAGRLFLFDKNQVRFFGMCEQTPVPDGRCEALDLILHHQPGRSTYGTGNFIFRGQAKRAVSHIARCLLGKPTDLVCWRWEAEAWPEHWEAIRRHPFRTALRALTLGIFRGLRDQWRREGKFFPSATLNGSVYHALVCIRFWRLRRLQPGGRKI